MGGNIKKKTFSDTVERLQKQLMKLKEKHKGGGGTVNDEPSPISSSDDDDEDNDETITTTRSGGGKTTTYVRVISKKSGGEDDVDDASASDSDSDSDSSSSSSSDDEDDRYGGEGTIRPTRSKKHRRKKTKKSKHHETSPSHHPHWTSRGVMMYGGNNGVVDERVGGGMAGSNGVTTYIQQLQDKLASSETRIQTLESRLAKMQGFTQKRMAGDDDEDIENDDDDNEDDEDDDDDDETTLTRSAGAGARKQKKKATKKKKKTTILPSLKRWSDYGWNYKLDQPMQKRRKVLRKIVAAWGALKVFRHLNQLATYNKKRPTIQKKFLGDRDWVKKTFYGTKRWAGAGDYGNTVAVFRNELLRPNGDAYSGQPRPGERFYGSSIYGGKNQWWMWNSSIGRWVPISGVMGHTSSMGGGDTEPLQALIGEDGFTYTGKPNPGTQFYARPVNAENYSSNYDTYTWDGRMWVNLSEGRRFGGIKATKKKSVAKKSVAKKSVAKKTSAKKKKSKSHQVLKAKTIYARLKPSHLKKGYKLDPQTHRPMKQSTGKVARLIHAIKKSVYKRLFGRQRKGGDEEDIVASTTTTTSLCKPKLSVMVTPKHGGNAKKLNIPKSLLQMFKKR